MNGRTKRLYPSAERLLVDVMLAHIDADDAEEFAKYLRNRTLLELGQLLACFFETAAV